MGVSPVKAGLVGSVVVGYLAGSFPSADVAARAAGSVDLRRLGSGNPGALNAATTLGTGWGLAVMGADIGKGYAATLAGGVLAGSLGANLAGTAAVVGHCYPVHNPTGGGKGVAASVGQVLGTFPVYFPIDFGVALATAAIPWFTHRTTAATAAASCAWIGCTALWRRNGWANPGGVEVDRSLTIAAVASSSLIAWRFARAAK